jgi:hypothetical protein
MNLPLAFVENRGQIGGEAAYYVHGHEKSLYFTPEGITFALNAPEAPGSRWAVKLDFVDARPGVAPAAEGLGDMVVSYFKGPREQWKTGIRTYSKVAYRDLWPGIDLVYEGTVNRLKYSFLIKPGAEPDAIQLAYRGASGVRIDEEGRIEVSTPVGGFHDDAPFAYQEIDGKRVEVASAYVLDEGAARYGFHLDAYDHARPLVLDPAVFVYCGYIGGAGNDSGNGIAVDSAGSAYVTGTTSSTEDTFPVAVGPDSMFNGGDSDAFIAKVKADGTGLVYAGYIGGSGADLGKGVAVDSDGNAYVTGTTSSTEASFPVRVGPDLTFNGGDTDAFVVKVNACGTDLDYAGYIGGSGIDSGNGIAVDSYGHAYVTGTTDSTECSFPVRVGPDLTYNGGDSDAFVAKIEANGTDLDYAGYIGGSGADSGEGIAVNAAGRAYVTGATSSTEATFPVKVGPDLVYNGGFSDAFVAKVKSSGASLVYAGYIGGSLRDSGSGIAVDAAGSAYVTGTTDAAAGDFPLVVGPDLIGTATIQAFITKIAPTGSSLVYSGYVTGGSAIPGSGDAVAVDGAGNAYALWGEFRSVAVNKVTADGTGFVYHLSFTNNSRPSGSGIAVDGAGNAYITGRTGVLFNATVGPDLTFNGGDDAFVAKIADTSACTLAVTTETTTLSSHNHKYAHIALSDCITSVVDSCAGPLTVDAANATITRVTSDEPESAPGTGNTCNDALIVDYSTVALVRAERKGGGNGRVYSIDFTVTGPSGDTASGSCKVQVPASGAAVEDSPVFCVGAECGTIPVHDPACTN